VLLSLVIRTGITRAFQAMEVTPRALLLSAATVPATMVPWP